MVLYIKNMVCNRCIAAVQILLNQLQLRTLSVILGEANIDVETMTPEKSKALKTALQAAGFELIDDRKSLLIEQIKNLVIETVHYSEPLQIKYSAYLSEKLQHDYSYLSKLFSEVEGLTIEHYIIKQKIERAKELLVYDELSLSQIADKLGYSSVAHLSAQFKKVTGLTPTFYKSENFHNRTPLDQVK